MRALASVLAGPVRAGMPSSWRATSPRDLLGNRRLITDTAAAPLVFVVANRLADLPVAASAALAVALLVVALRLALGHRWGYALGGVGGVGVALGAALWSGEALGYFGPAMLLNVGYAVGAVLSIALRRPLVGWLGALVYRWPLAWHWHPRVRPAYTAITWAWAGMFAVRAGVRYELMARGQLELLAVAHIALGLPALAALIALTCWYLPRRLRRLDAPDVSAFRPAAL